MSDKRGKATETELGDMHGKITSALTRRIEATDFAAADMANAIAWMKHNSITADPEQNDALAQLREKLKQRQRGKPISAEDIARAQLEVENQLGLGDTKGPMQ